MKKIILAAIIGTTLSGTAIAKQVNNDNNVVFGGAKSGFVIEVEQKMMQYNADFTPVNFVDGDTVTHGSVDQSMTFIGAGYQWHGVQTNSDVLLKATLVYAVTATGQFEVVPEIDLDSFGAKFKASTSVNPERNVFVGFETGLLSTRYDGSVNQNQTLEFEAVQLTLATTLDIHITDSLAIGGMLGIVANSADVSHHGLKAQQVGSDTVYVPFNDYGKFQAGFMAGVNVSYTF